MNKAAFETKYNDATSGLYRAGQTAGIDSSDHRSLVSDIISSVSWPEDATFWKQQRVKVKTVAALPAYTYSTVSGVPTLTANANGVLTVDGVTVLLGDSVMVSEESTSNYNGVYVCTVQGTSITAYVLTLREDSRTSDQIAYALYKVRLGSTNEDTIWKQTFDETGSAISNVAYEEFTTGGGGSGEAEAYTSIASVDVLTLFSKPIQLIAAPGAGLALAIMAVTLNMNYNSVAYDTNTTLTFYFPSESGGVFYDDTILAKTNKNPNFIQPAIQTCYENEGFYVRVLTANPLNGDSNLRITVKYKTITI